MSRPNASQIDDDTLDALYAELEAVERYLGATHQYARWHDSLGENYGCAGCELRNGIRAALYGPQGAQEPPDAPEPQLAPEKPSDARTARQETP